MHGEAVTFRTDPDRFAYLDDGVKKGTGSMDRLRTANAAGVPRTRPSALDVGVELKRVFEVNRGCVVA
jgi:hypothetical protein